MNAIFFLSVSYISSFISKYSSTSWRNLSRSLRFPVKGFGCPIFSSPALGVVVKGTGSNGFTVGPTISLSLAMGSFVSGSSGFFEIVMLEVVVDRGLPCSNRAVNNLSVGSDSSGAVSKLACVSVVSGVSFRGIAGIQRASMLRGSKLVTVKGWFVGSLPSVLWLRGLGSSLSDSESSDGRKIPLGREGVFDSGGARFTGEAS